MDAAWQWPSMPLGEGIKLKYSQPQLLSLLHRELLCGALRSRPHCALSPLSSGCPDALPLMPPRRERTFHPWPDGLLVVQGMTPGPLWEQAAHPWRKRDLRDPHNRKLREKGEAEPHWPTAFPHIYPSFPGWGDGSHSVLLRTQGAFPAPTANGQKRIQRFC